jgi:hypothetical protein
MMRLLRGSTAHTLLCIAVVSSAMVGCTQITEQTPTEVPKPEIEKTTVGTPQIGTPSTTLTTAPLETEESVPQPEMNNPDRLPRREFGESDSPLEIVLVIEQC